MAQPFGQIERSNRIRIGQQQGKLLPTHPTQLISSLHDLHPVHGNRSQNGIPCRMTEVISDHLKWSRSNATTDALWSCLLQRANNAPDWIVRCYNQRGTAEQHIKEGKYGFRCKRLSWKLFRDNEGRLQLHAVAYNLATFLRCFELPETMAY